MPGSVKSETESKVKSTFCPIITLAISTSLSEISATFDVVTSVAILLPELIYSPSETEIVPICPSNGARIKVLSNSIVDDLYDVSD